MNRALDNQTGSAILAIVFALVLIVVVSCVVGGWAYMLGDLLLGSWSGPLVP